MARKKIVNRIKLKRKDDKLVNYNYLSIINYKYFNAISVFKMYKKDFYVKYIKKNINNFIMDIKNAYDLYQVPDDGTLPSLGSNIPDNVFDDDDNDNDDRLSVSLNSFRSIQSNETLLLETDDEVGAFFADDNATLPSYSSSHILEKAFENDEIEYKNPIYNDFDYNFSLTDFDSNILNNVMKYSLNKQDDDNNDEKIEVSKNIDLDYRLKRPLLWSDFINYYWIGLFNNLKHKRNYVEYCNQVMNFKKKINIISQKINITNTEEEEKEKEKINYFNIENYDVNNYDSKNLFTISESNKILTEIEELFNMIDKLLIDDIIFMKNAKAPIGDFLHRYNSIKNDCLKLSNIKNNKIFNHARCSTEIKQYKNSKSIKKIKDKFDKEVSDKVKKEFEEKFKDDLIKDKEYIEKDKFLYSLKEWMMNVILEEKEKEENFEMIFNYHNRQTLYIGFIAIIYSVYYKLQSIYSKVRLINNEKLNEKHLNIIERNINFASSILVKEIDLIRLLPTEEKKRLGRESLNLFKYSFINKDEYVISEVSGPMAHDIAANSSYWCYQNTKMIKDSYKLLDFFNELNIQKGELKVVTKFIKTTKEHLSKLLKEENKFERVISNWYGEKEKKKKILYKSNIFSEKEVWWYYFVYNSKIYYSDDRINDESCCYPNTENNDVEKGTLINNEEEKPEEIKIFLETNSYLYHVINKDRPKYPLHKDFKWDKLDFNKDKIEFSKRQLRYNKYFIEKLNNELINNELKQINDLNESLVRKNFILDCIEHIEEVLNELENMSNFIKEGVLLNEQLFFKLVLFGINILIFIGQYFWNNHIKPSI